MPLVLSGSNGIRFPNGAQSQSTYEEGSWTPTLSTGASSVVYSGNNAGLYVKIGRMVYFSANLTYSSYVGSTNLTGGLPFPCQNGNESFYWMSVTPYVNSGLAQSTNRYINGYVDRANPGQIYWSYQPLTSPAVFANGPGNIYFCGYYMATT
jgi:hypothetical protein